MKKYLVKLRSGFPKSCSFYSEAEADFNQTIDYYENYSKGLRCDFEVEVYLVISDLLFARKFECLQKERLGDAK